MRNVTECQQRLIVLGYLPARNEFGEKNDDGKFGERSLDAYNHFRATLGKGPVVQASMAELNADLFPEEQPAPPAPKPNPLHDFFTGLATKAVLNHLKGLPAMNFLSGQKTVITGVLMVVVGGISLVAPLIGLGAIPGFDALSPGEAWTSITGGFGLIFLRQGVTKEVKKVSQ
jgi:hypothetical protein